MAKTLLGSISIAAVSTAVAVSATASSASAALFVYTDRDSFLAHTSEVTTLGFEGIAAPNSFVPYASPAGYSSNGVTFTDNTSDFLFVVDPGFVSERGNAYSFMNHSAVLSAPAGHGYPKPDVKASSLDGRFATNIKPVTAFGTDIAALVLDKGTTPATSFSTPTSFVLSVLGQSFTITPGIGKVGFIGVVSTEEAITSFSITAPDSLRYGPTIDNFTFGQAKADVAEAVPEPLSVVGVLTAAGLGAALKRRRQ